MKFLITSILLLSTVFPSLAQKNLPCGTQLTQKQIQLINARKRSRPATARFMAEEVSNVAITAHILRTSEGTGGLSEANLDDAIQTVNDFYVNANLSFFILGEINYIDSDDFYDFDTDEEAALTANNVDNTVNIYFANSVSSGESLLCGYAYFSGSGADKDIILMDNGCAINGSTLPHEIGHFFDLYHTHGTTNNGTTDELVDGSNCETAGDNICDTPADPNLSGVVNFETCAYEGTATDANDDEYTPDTNNIMSYSVKDCRTQFSAGQYAAIADTYANDRNYLISKNLVADFGSNLTTICSGGSVIFSDQSISANSWSWEFPGGTPATSDEQNPEVSYATAGTYNVTLTITNSEEEADAKTYSEYIVVEDAAVNPPEDLTIGFETIETEFYTIENEDNDYTFEISSIAIDGDQSMMMDFLNYDRIGEEDYLILDEIDLANGNSYRLTYDRAYATYDEDYRDSLAIMIAEPCTYNWELFYAYSPDDLATTIPHTSSFVPLSGEWKRDQLLITFDESWDGAQLAFKTINGFGNNLYMDQIILEPLDTDYELQDVIVNCTSDESTDDGSIEIIGTASGNLTYSLDKVKYQEETTFNSLAAGEYTLYIQQEGDLVSQQNITISSAASIDVEITTDADGNLVADAEVSNFQWYFAGEQVAGATSSTLDFQGGGVYFVIATNEAGCSAKSDEFAILDVPLSISALKIYPNPTSTFLNIELPDSRSATVEIIDLTGNKIISDTISSIGKNQIDVHHLSSGIYVMQLTTQEGTLRQKFRKL